MPMADDILATKGLPLEKFPVIREEALTMPPNFTTLRATVQRSLALSELENGKGLKKRVLPVRQSSQQ